MRALFFSFVSFALTVLFYWLWWQTPLLSQLDYKFYDRIAHSFPSRHSPDSTLVVEIDEKSLEAFGQWPWPRMITSELVNTIADAKPASIVFDIIFSEKDRSSPDTLKGFYRELFGLNVTVQGLPKPLESNDRLLSDAMNRTVSVLPVFADSNNRQTSCFLPNRVNQSSADFLHTLTNIDSLVCSLPRFQQHAQGSGHIHATADKDGILRRLPLFIRNNDNLVPTLGMAAVGTSNEALIRIYPVSPLIGDMGVEISKYRFTMDKFAEGLLHFYPADQYHRVSAYDLLHGNVDPKRMEGKIVFIGSSALGLDTRHTITDGTMRPGVFVHATLAENILNNDLSVQPDVYKPLAILTSFFTALVLLFWMNRKRYLHVVLLFAAAAVISFVLTYALWEYHIYISIGYFVIPLFSFLFVLGLLMFIIDYRNTKKFIADMQKAAEQKQRLSNALEQSESEREYQKTMLFQQSKLAAMGEMIDNIAHQWRQPLNMLGVIIQDVEYAYHSGKVNEDYLHTMSSESMEQIVFMSQTIEDFRNFVKPDQTNAPFDLNEAVSKSLQLLSGMFESHGIEIDVRYCDVPLEINGSISEFKQVMINLLQNSRDALDERKPALPKIIIRLLTENSNAVLSLQDNGGGIAENIIGRIFEPYFTTKEEGKGSGIGLYMSYAIIRTKMGGNINVANTDGGTLFTISIPLRRHA
ncbi:CHASE2 domain-containing protein [Sulfuricurvum sp.]|uniref:CHASE2 domain-containing protein n=1 Tax=Sulfuricurvum sp. TaxID=2025608 RepID=UPI0026237459|nr:CHASE2 domain-containing protein [Sulfuricurvum sp.]MDD3596714.1 CHASE2 domain-containing protein [Sulfuricurvum sp.]